MKRVIKISVTRTMQVDRFEPVSVTVEETIEVRDGDGVPEARTTLYKEVTQQVKKYIDNEARKYKKEQE